MDKIKTKLRNALTELDVKKIRNIAEDINIVDLAELLNDFTNTEIILVIRSLHTEEAADLFAYLDPTRQEMIVEAINSEELNEIIEAMYSDEIVELIDELPANLTKKVIAAASKETRKNVNKILRYPEFSTGYLMTTEFIALKENLTVEQALTELKSLESKNVETYSYIYLVDASKTLKGWVRLQDLVFASNKTRLSKICDENVVAVRAIDDQEIAANLMSKYDVSTLPVVTNQNKLVGIVTSDDIIDVIQEEATEDIHKMAAVAPTEGTYSETGVVTSFKSRIGWLLILMITATISQIIIDNWIGKSDISFEGLDILTVFAALIPLMMDTAGNAGGQSGAVIIRALSIGDIDTKDYWKIVWKEIRTAILIALVIFCANYGRMILMGKSSDLSLITSTAIFITIVVAKFLGASLPIFAKKFKLDPATVAAPLITTIVDLLALIILFLTFIMLS